MRQNKKGKKLFHASLKTSRSDDGTTAKIVVCTIGAIGIVALSIALIFAFRSLHATWLRECVIRDVSAQVTIHAPAHIPKEAIRLGLGLKEGENLAKLDFEHMRKELIEKYPAIRNIEIERRLPDKVEIFVEEREPVARLEVKGRRNSSGLVVDSEGVVFERRRGGVELLPSILEKASSTTPKGAKLDGLSRAALELVLMGREKDFENLKLNTIDSTNNDYLLCAMGNSQLAKIAWEGMLEKPTTDSRGVLKEELFQLKSVVESNMVPTQGLTWNVLEVGRITIDTKEPQ